ncbi:conserved hypothetical protein distantly related to alpha-glycosyltransferases family 4 [Synechococcus sp. Minos11]|uniref:glycosyltransferase family 4 protein n=1 Tax=Synechococcus sp. Minos11 TaxID=221341 RepID=UPI001647EDA0|nr:glycosyltransferase family 4 protein [Synechococcus sp. Minos11]QNJ07678.1 conserved hypothetical protein distantly related to alpha-glycosyltransferases family 4 [Synechococcus sp. Minos11]
MKITIVVGGRWHAFDLAKGLYDNNHLHRIITNYPCWFVKKWGIPEDKICSLPFTFYLVKLIYKIGGERLMMKCQWFVHKWFSIRAASYLEGSELIHGWSQWSEDSLIWAIKNGVPTVLERSSAHITEQCILLRNEYKRIGKKWEETHKKIVSMEIREYNMCSCVAVPSLFVEESFKKYDFPSDKIYRNPLGVNVQAFESNQIKLLKSFNVIFAGSLSVRKGIQDLVNGFLLAEIQDSQLILIGGQTTETRHFLENAPDCVIKTGHIKQNMLRKYYSLGSCFVLPSIEEGMAMVQMQALAAGLPLICSTNTGGEDLLWLSNKRPIQHEGNIKEFPAGFVIPINSPRSISYCLQLLKFNSLKQKAMSNEAKEIAKQKLSWGDYAYRSIKNYERLVLK